MFFEVYSNDNSIIYNSKTTFNFKTGILSIIIDNIITGNIIIHSIYNNSNDAIEIKKTIIDKDHFHISLNNDNSKLIVTPLDTRYKKIFPNEIKDLNNLMTMTLIKTVNDISYHVEDFNLENDENDFYFNISNITIQNGDYLFIPYYNGFEYHAKIVD